MATLKDYRDERLRKLEELKKLGINPYPADSERTHNLSDITDKFGELEGQEVSVVGRIVNLRKFGKIAFIVIRDASGKLQLFLREGTVEGLDATKSQLGIEHLNLLDSGDFVQARGKVIKTQTGEISVDVKRLRILTKSLRPLPNAQEGFTNKEERLRRRYVDLNVNEDVRQRFIRRSKFWQATRDFLNKEGFTEINIPVLEGVAGGADANPFVTHMDALDQDFYLRISHELPLKRLLVGGYEKVYDIGPRFRNENYSEEHLPEHVAMEWYWAYADWEQGIELTERMIRAVVDATWGKRQFTLADGQQVDFGKDGERFPRISFVDVLKEQYGIDVFKSSMADIAARLKENKLEVEKQDNRQRSLDKLWKKYRKTIAGPVFLVDMPVFMQPLAKAQKDSPELTEQFNLVFGGSEMCKAFSELNDPIDQLNRFKEQQAMRDAGDDEAQMMDIDFVEALEYAMPPACGLGYSERIFWSLEGVSAREGVVFPQLRREVDEVTKSVYPDINFAAMVQKPTAKLTNLPESAAEQGTKKLYLDDYALLECDAKVVSAEDLGEGSYRLVLDQTCVYPGGGGQDFDLGEVSWDGGKLVLAEISKDKAGIVHHDGRLEGAPPQTGATTHVKVDQPRRFLNSRLHCAGHLVDYAVQKAGKDAWEPGKGSHFPGRCYVEYKGEFNPEESESLARKIEEILAGLAAEGGAITSARVKSGEAHKYSKYIPQVILDSYQNVHIAKYPHDFNICCGGTHLTDVSQLGSVVVTQIKKKDGNIRVSYNVPS